MLTLPFLFSSHFSYLVTMQTIVFNVTKKETHDPQNGMKKLLRRLRGAFKVSTGKEDLIDYLEDDVVPNCVVFGGPRKPSQMRSVRQSKII